jgi:pyridoxamine 5'-phosphate oxidase
MASTRQKLRALKILAGMPPEFDLQNVPADPRELFLDWLELAIASGAAEPHAMTLSTLGMDGMPDARILLLKDVTPTGFWCFASGAGSTKGLQLAVNPVAAMTFYWPSLVRSVRLRGHVEIAPAETSAEDFRDRALAARAVALAGVQSSPLNAMDDGPAALAAARELLGRDDRTTPKSWTVWMLRPMSIEFWQGDPDRQHIRLQYQLTEDRWSSTLLWP